MSNELDYYRFYRGISTYEVAVKKRLNQLEQSGVRNTVAVLNGIRNMEYGIRSDIRESTYAIVASQELLADIFYQGFDAVNNTLDFGFSRVASGLADIDDSIKAMNDAICGKLDALHDIMDNPRLTAARELYRRATTNFEKGYFEESLQDCLQAVEKERTDYFTWYLLGNIYLFGAGKFSNTIDPLKAEEAFFNSAKYIDADIDSSDEARKFASLIYYSLGHSRLALSNDLLVENKLDESQKKLEEAKEALEKSIELDASNSKSFCDYAKVLHFLGKDEESLECMDNIMDSDESFALFFVSDKNFESIWNQIESLITKKKTKKIDDLKQRIREGIYQAINEVEPGTFRNKLLNLKQQVDDELEACLKLDYLTFCRRESKIESKYQKMLEDICLEYKQWHDRQIEIQEKQREKLEVLESWNYLFKVVTIGLKSGNTQLFKMYKNKYYYKDTIIDTKKTFLKRCKSDWKNDWEYGKTDILYSSTIKIDFDLTSIEIRFKLFGRGWREYLSSDCNLKYYLVKNNWRPELSLWNSVPDDEKKDLSKIRLSHVLDPRLRVEECREYHYWETSSIGSTTESLKKIAKALGYQMLIDTIDSFIIELKKYLDRIINFEYKGCFITTATCQSRGLPDNCHELETLRKFRDTFMRKSPDMNAEVEEYYRIAPVICSNINKQNNAKEIYDLIWEDYLKSAVSAVCLGENQKAHDIYKKMVLDLKEKWF